MIVSQSMRFVFVSTPKCATHTMYEVLHSALYNGLLLPGGNHNNQVPEQFRSFYIFSIVRNPYSRAVSLWTFTRKRGDDVPESLADYVRLLIDSPEKAAGPKAGLSQAEWLRPVPLTRVLWLESLAADFQVLPFYRGPDTLPQRNASDHRPWQEYMTTEIADLIDEWAGQDFHVFGYPRWAYAKVHV